MSCRVVATLLLCGVLVVQHATAQKLEKLSAQINTVEYDEIAPVLSRDGNTLYFTRVGSPDFCRELLVDGQDVSQSDPDGYGAQLRKAYESISGRNIADPVISDFNQDVWIAESRLDFFDLVSHPGGPLNNALPNSICAQTTQPNEFVVINQFPRKGGMAPGFSLIRQLPDGGWSYPEPLSIRHFYTNSPGINLTLSGDGTVMILALQREDSRGHTDLYVSLLESDGSWSTPQSLGVSVNSSYRETSPFLTEDLRTLYFASDRPGAQGLDIYSAERTGGWQQWSTPKRLQAPINSAADESQPFFHAGTGFLYFSSGRDGTRDLFRYLLKEPEGQDEVVVTGRILNSATKEQLPARILLDFGEEFDDDDFYLSADGNFRLRLPKGKTIQLLPEKRDFIGQPVQLAYNDEYYFSIPELVLFLDPIRENAQISLRPIYFHRSKPIILTRSYGELDRLARILIDRPDIHIRIEGHTDNQGPVKALQKLSEERAEAVRDYLVRQGIAPERIETKGFGASRPVTDNGTEDQRARNRRVDVRITKVDEGN